MIQRATTTTGPLSLSKSLLHTLLKRVPASRRKAGTRNQSCHLAEFCRKFSLCFRSTAVSWSVDPSCSIKEIARDSCSSTQLGTHRYSGDDSQSGCTQANTCSDRTRSQRASSDSRRRFPRGPGRVAQVERESGQSHDGHLSAGQQGQSAHTS